MHLCPDELIVLSAMVRSGYAVVSCAHHGVMWLVCLIKPYPPREEATAGESYNWHNWHPGFIREDGEHVHFDEPGGG